MTNRTLIAFWPSILGGLWMMVSGRFMYGSFGRMPTAAWGRHHMMWGRGMMGYLGMGWPWLGLIAGAIVVVSAIALYAYPQYRRSLGMTILLVSLLNLFFGMGGLLASLLSIFGGVVALTPREISPE